MKKRSEVGKEVGKTLQIIVDYGNEQIIIGGAVHSRDFRKKALKIINYDKFGLKEHQQYWKVISELERRNLEFSIPTAQQIFSSEDINWELFQELVTVHEGKILNVDHHLELFLWEKARDTCLTGPVQKMLSLFSDSTATPDVVRSSARMVVTALEGYTNRKYLRHPEELIGDQINDIRQRMRGLKQYSYGLDGLDFYPDKGEGFERQRRMIPGAAPGKVTVITGVSGAGKSTFAANLILGLYKQEKKIAVGAWEMGGGTTLETLACMQLGYRRELVAQGKIVEEDVVKIEQVMHDISKFVRFIENPFRRHANERSSNERNLDLVHGYIADIGADVFVADLWERCLVDSDTEEEKHALFRQQAMVEEMKIHGILLAQQRLKDVEMRVDKRPTREGIKGSAAWVEVADAIIGVHRPALWKNVPDISLEVYILKQRYGKWPLAIEFYWDPHTGVVSGGRELSFEPNTTEAVGSNDMPIPVKAKRKSK
jgi:replicative DNA helicase